MKDRKKYTKKNKNNFGTAVNFCFPNEKPYSLDELRFIWVSLLILIGTLNKFFLTPLVISPD